MLRIPAWHVINAAQSPEQVHNEIHDIVQATLSSLSQQEEFQQQEQQETVGGPPLGKLWESGTFDVVAENGGSHNNDDKDGENKTHDT